MDLMPQKLSKLACGHRVFTLTVSNNFTNWNKSKQYVTRISIQNKISWK